LNAIHAKLQRELRRYGVSLDAIVFCPHGPEDACECRKPKPGLLREVGARLQVDLCGVPVIGDTLRDIEAAREVDALPVLVRTGKGERTLAMHVNELKDVPVYADLAAAVAALLAGELHA
jgi:D-glycero-D-manno-heptose 1,7-bisphosphate phosphatase